MNPTPANNDKLQGNDSAKQGAAHPLDVYSPKPEAKKSDKEAAYFQSQAPTISLPKGGGAIKGIDEKFTVNAVNGTSALQVPLPLTPARGSFTPSLALDYNSGSGNSAFGLGWNLSLPSIQRKTDRAIPLYNDVVESDVFIMAGAEDLVPVVDGSGNPVIDTSHSPYTVKRYCPRIEGLFARIEYITKAGTTGGWWRVTTKENIVTYYGLTVDGRIADPLNSYRIYKWLPQFSYDFKGNVQLYEYIAEDMEMAPSAIHERNRHNDLSQISNKYLKRVKYCNNTHYVVPDANVLEPSLSVSLNFMMEAVFDYGDHDLSNPTPSRSTTQWPARKDAFSDFHPGFEMRTYRLCRRVLMFHYFKELNDGITPLAVLVRSLDLTYLHDGETNYCEADFITTLTQSGYQKNGSSYIKKSLPPVTCDYFPLQWDTQLHNVLPEDVKNAPQGLTGPYRWIDLWGEGLPGILTEQGDGWFYKNNKGDGHFSVANRVASKPSLSGLGTTMQWEDLDADGRRQVVSRNLDIPGYFELDDDQRWQSFRAFKHNARINWDSPFTKLIDLDGDGKPDILLTEDRVWTWFKNEGKEGHSKGGIQHVWHDEEQGPRLLVNDPVQSVFLADMNGDGLTDLVRIKNGEVCYWPNMGYGKFGPKVAMTDAPHFDNPDDFNPLYIILSDISGTGAADIIYIGNNRCTAWINCAGNAFSKAVEINPLPGTEPYSKVAVLDFLGNGTSCIVWSSPLPQHAHAPMRYIDLMGGNKPYLLSTYSNGMGKTVTLQYRSSTKYYLADKEAGSPWATRLPFPVYCVSQIETADAVSDTAYTQSFLYHHGYYDHDEREFRGFGRVDTIDDESAAFYKTPVLSDELDQWPVLTKTWYHTGAWLREKKLLDAFADEYYTHPDWWQAPPVTELPAGLTAVEVREAHRAFKSMPLRQEIYAIDNDVLKKDIPYAVTAFSYCCNVVQHQYNNRFASFYTYQQQKVTWNCERVPTDPRVLHELTLDTDEYGNILQNASVAYPRNGDIVSFEDINDALALININNSTTLKATMDSILDMNETAGKYYQWLERNNIIAPEIFFSSGGLQFPDAAQYQIGTGDFSVEAWIKTSSSGGTVFEYDSPFSGWSGGSGVWPGGIHLFISDWKLYLFVSDGINSYKQLGTASTAIPANAWTHIVVTRDHPVNVSNWKIYINGAPVSVTPAGGGMTGGNFNGGTGDTLNIGKRVTYTPDYFSGVIKTVRWYNRTLGSEEIELLSQVSGQPPLSGVVFDMGIDVPAGAASDISRYRAGEGSTSGTAQVRYSLTGNAQGMALTGGTLELAAVQGTMLVTGTETDYTTDAIAYTHYRLRQPCDVRNMQLHGATAPAASFWQPADLKYVLDNAAVIDYAANTWSGVKKRIVARQQTTFYDNDAAAELPLGQLQAVSMPYTTRHLAFTRLLVDSIYDVRADNTYFTAGGYVLEQPSDPGSDLWLHSGTIQYDKTHFYSPHTYTDPWGNDTVVAFWDNYYLLPASVTDEKGNVTTVNAYDWRCLQPCTITDINDNVSELLYDALCMPVAMALKGKVSGSVFEADELGSLDPNNSTDITNQQKIFNPAFGPAAVAADLLGHATWRCVYDLNASPVAVTMIARELHYQYCVANSIPASPLQVRFTYTDGFGRVAMHKAQAANDPSGGAVRWAGSGKTVYNNKGNVVLQYEPYYSSTFAFDHAAQAAAGGVSPRMHYDPLSRPWMVEQPDGSYSKTEWTAWLKKEYDGNDTVLDSTWYDDMITAGGHYASSAAKAAVHNDTPLTTHLDTLARPFYAVQHNKVPNGSGGWNNAYYGTLSTLDILGNPLKVTDDRGIDIFTYSYDMLQAPIRMISADKGMQLTIADAAGQPLYAWDADERRTSMEYDQLRRPLKKKMYNGSSITLETTEYGETATTPKTYNLRGQVYKHYDGAGLTQVNQYDFKGNPLVSAQTMLTNYAIADVNWDALTPPALNTFDVFTTTTAYDALSRPIKLTDPGANETTHVYDKAGMLYQVSMKPSGGSVTNYITAIQYNARGQRTLITYGNATSTSYEYDSYRFRLKRLRTTKSTDVFQDLNYYYDPAGNICYLNDISQRALYFNNSVTLPVMDYTYDAIYRLLQANGREQANSGSSFGAQDNYSDDLWMGFVHKANDNITQNYTEKYTYDSTGNMLELQHIASLGSYTRNYNYDTGSNRLLSTEIGSTAYDYTHDVHGNIITMPHLAYITYNSQQQMSSTGLGGGGDAYYQYSGGQRVRKVVVNGSLVKERLYFGGYEVYRQYTSGSLDLERITVHIADDSARIAMFEKRTAGSDSYEAQLQRYIYSNHIGTATLELTNTAEVISYEEYRPFGTTSFQSTNVDISAVAKRYRFSGKERDDESGFYYHGARYYIPWLARWAAVDPLAAKNAPESAYCYGHNNPIIWTDPDGMDPKIDPKHTGDQNKNAPENKEQASKRPTETLNWEFINKYVPSENNNNNPAKKIELSIFLDESLSQADKKKIDLETVKDHIERIYKENGIDINVNVITDSKKGNAQYEKFRKEELPLNEFVLKITDEPSMTTGSLAGVFIPTTDNYKLVVNYGHIKSKNISFNTGREMGADINYQVGNTAAHETLHAIINSVIKFYGIPQNEFYSNFHLGSDAHTKEFGNLLDASGLPSKPSIENDGILGEQVMAINLFLNDIANPSRNKQSSIRVMNQFSRSSYEKRHK